MDIKKTDVFSGIGVAVLDGLIRCGISYANKKQMDIGRILIGAIVIGIVIGVLVYFIRNYIKKTKQIKEDNNQIQGLQNRNDELTQQVQGLQNRNDELTQQIQETENDLNICDYKLFSYNRLDPALKRIWYVIESDNRCENRDINGLLKDIERFFEDDKQSKNVIFNLSIFVQSDENYKIIESTRHSPSTIKNLSLNDDSFVGNSIKKKKVDYCGSISERDRQVKFVELDNPCNYESILSVPFVMDDNVLFSLVITANEKECIQETYYKFEDTIMRYLEILAILVLLKEER